MLQIRLGLRRARLRLSMGGARLGQLGPRLTRLLVQLGRVDPGEHLSGGDTVPDVHVRLAHEPFDRA